MGPNKLHEGHTKFYETRSLRSQLEKQRFTFDVDKKHTYICIRQRDNWNLSGPSSIAGGAQSVIEACSYFFKGGSQKY